MFTWDEAKRRSNLLKHKLDFADAALVYHNPEKYTRRSIRDGEERNADIAILETAGTCLTLVYVQRGEDIRVVSFRTASRSERKLHAESRKSD